MMVEEFGGGEGGCGGIIGERVSHLHQSKKFVWFT